MPRHLHGIRTFARQISENRHHIRDDLKLVWQYRRLIPELISPWNSDPAVRSELHPKSYNNWGDVINLSLQALVPMERVTYSPGTLACLPAHYAIGTHQEKWFFINGICTSPPIAILNGLELAELFQRPIHLIHTPTYGILWDLWDSMTARTLRKDGQLSQPAYQVVKEALTRHDKVVIVGHSQGTLVASYIARKLLRERQYAHLAARLEIYCLAGVTDSFRVDPTMSEHFGRSVPYVEHFANSGDFFCQIGILAHHENSAGPIYVSERNGHLLNDHYIPGLRDGAYCDGHSRLHGYVAGRSPSAAAYATYRPHEVSDSSASIETLNPP